MKEFKVNDLNIKVRGEVVLSFLDAFGAYRSRGEKVMARHCGVTVADITGGTLLVMQRYLDAMEELSQQFGTAFLRRVGASVYENVQLPEVESLNELLALVDVAYHQHHVEHGDQIGHYVWKRSEDNAGVMTCDTPYPCSFDLGLLTNFAGRFADNANVTHVDGPCRAAGDDVCSYALVW